MQLEFKGETLLPKVNGDIYFAIYELENWLRRICLTAYMLEFGSSWLQHVPKSLPGRTKSRLRRNAEYYYLDADSDDNLMWVSTHGELKELLLNDTVQGRVEALTGLTRDRLIHELDELREIRNLLAHNRALSDTTARIADGLVASFRLAVERFKDVILYPSFDSLHVDDNESVSRYFEQKREAYSPRLQAYIAYTDSCYYINCLPMPDHYDKHPRAATLIRGYRNQLSSILAFALNKAVDEYALIVPKKSGNDETRAVIDMFFSVQNVWTDTDYENQRPKYVCHPKIWFYENRRPIDE